MLCLSLCVVFHCCGPWRCSLSLCVVFRDCGWWIHSLFESVCCVSVLWSVKAQFVWVCVLCFSAVAGEDTVCLSLYVVFQCCGQWRHSLFESVCYVSVLWSVKAHFVWVCILCFSAVVSEGTFCLSLHVVFQCCGQWRHILFESVCCISVLWSVKAQFVWVCMLCFSAVVSEGTVCLSLCVVFQCCGQWRHSLFESVCCVSVLCLSLCVVFQCCIWVCMLCFSSVVSEGMVCLSLCVVFQYCGQWLCSLFESACCVSGLCLILCVVFQC